MLAKVWTRAVVGIEGELVEELVANRRAFLYSPLRHHFQQNFQVRRRLIATPPAAAWTLPPRRPR